MKWDDLDSLVQEIVAIDDNGSWAKALREASEMAGTLQCRESLNSFSSPSKKGQMSPGKEKQKLESKQQQPTASESASENLDDDYEDYNDDDEESSWDSAKVMD